jgi:F-type H+-transporting ATPase subunit b
MIRSICIAAVLALFVLLYTAGSSELVLANDAAAEAGHGSHGDVSLNPMEWASNTAFWTLVIFLTVFGVLAKYGFGPIAKALDDREQGIADKITAAQRLNDEAKDLLKQYQEKLDASKEEVRKILEEARNNAGRVADDIVAKAQDAARLERDRAMKEIESATTSALQSIAERSATLAANLAGKMIRAEVKPEQHRSLIDAALEEFTRG